MDNKSKLVDHQSHHVPVQYIQRSQTGPVNGSRSPNDRKYKPVDNNSLQAKLRENRNSNNKENNGVINSTSKKEIMIVGYSMIKHVNGHEVPRDDSVKIRCHLGAMTDDITDYIRPRYDMIITHTGTNDIQNKVDSFQKVRKVIATIKEIDVE